jgi:hypothetical protein
MTLQMLYVHWKTVRLGLLPFVLAAFGLPLMVAQQMSAWEDDVQTMAASDALAGAFVWAPGFPLLAAATGVLLALSAWNWDHKSNHVYALSLPVSRQRYAMLKFTGGVLLALIPASALVLGSLLAAVSVDAPPEVRAYPFQLAGHFFLGIVIVYSMLFALASGTIRTTVVVLSILVGIPILLSFGEVQAITGGPSVSFWVSQAFRYGPLRILFGNWMLFDV